MSHWVILPILIPLAAAVLILITAQLGKRLRRTISLGSALLLIVVAVQLLTISASGQYQVYALGSWPAPYGIVLVLDRLSALMVALTAITAFVSILYAVHGDDLHGRNFHSMFQLQLMGINGAFLTGDLFNLFVFFEVLLIASYGLLLHGGGVERIRASVHYVVLNLAGSSLFLIALALLYGSLGTLNMADMAQEVGIAQPGDLPLIRTGGLLLLVVFALKAAVVPLYFWLPASYAAAKAPVAAQFSIMTKIGVYAIVRVFTLIFGAEAGGAAQLAEPWVLPLAALTLMLGMLGALAATRLRALVAYLVIGSVGTMLVGVGTFTQPGLDAALYYMIHSTLILAGFFLLAGIITNERAGAADRLEPAPPMTQPWISGLLFLVVAVAAAGVPPLSGFLGKVMVLEATLRSDAMPWAWAAVLIGGLLSLIAVARSGSTLYWNVQPGRTVATGERAAPGMLVSTAALIGAGVVLALFAKPITAFTGAAARQLLQPGGYIAAVLG